MASNRQPKRPADLTGTSGEMKLVEMACLAGLSSTAGKSAGRIMHEEVRMYGTRVHIHPSVLCNDAWKNIHSLQRARRDVLCTRAHPSSVCIGASKRHTPRHHARGVCAFVYILLFVVRIYA